MFEEVGMVVVFDAPQEDASLVGGEDILLVV